MTTEYPPNENAILDDLKITDSPNAVEHNADQNGMKKFGANTDPNDPPRVKGLVEIMIERNLIKPDDSHLTDQKTNDDQTCDEDFFEGEKPPLDHEQVFGRQTDRGIK